MSKRQALTYSISGSTITLTGVNVPLSSIYAILDVSASPPVVLYSSLKGGASSYTPSPNSTMVTTVAPSSNSAQLEILYDDGAAPAGDGVDGTGIVAPTGGSGIRGWLSGLFNVTSLIKGLLPTALGAQNASGSFSVAMALDQLMTLGQAAKSSSQSIVTAFDQPNLTTNTNIPLVLSPLTVNSYSATGNTAWVQVVAGAFYVVSIGKTYTAATISMTASGGAAGQNVITTATTPAGIAIGQQAVGTGIPAGSVVTGFVANTSVTISAPLTATASGTVTFTSDATVFTFQSSPDNGTTTNSLNAVLLAQPSVMAPASTQYNSGLYVVQAPITTTGNSYIRVNIGTLTNATVRIFIDPFTMGARINLPYNLPNAATQANWVANAAAVPIIDTNFIQDLNWDVNVFSGSGQTFNYFTTNDPLLGSFRKPYASQMDGAQSPQAQTSTAAGIYQIAAKNRYFCITETGSSLTGWSIGGFTGMVSPSSSSIQAPNAITISQATPANCKVDANTIGGNTMNINATNGATNKALDVYTAGPIPNTDYSAVALTAGATGTQALVADATGAGTSVGYNINLSAFVAGSSGGIIFGLQESPDSGTTTYRTIWTCEPLTATGIVVIPPLPVNGRRRLAWWTVANTTITSGTITVTAQGISGVCVKQGQFYDRGTVTVANQNFTGSAASTLSLTAVNSGSSSATSPVLIEGYKALKIALNIASQSGTTSTAPVLTLQVSDDNVNWATTAVTLTGPLVAGTVAVFTNNVCGRFARLVTTTAQSGATTYVLGYTSIYGTN